VKFSKDELRLVARSKGWTGGRASKDDVLTWLNQRGVQFQDIAKIVGDMRRSARGVAPSTAPAVAVPAGLSKTEVEQMIAEKFSPAAALDMKEVRRIIAEAVAKQQPARVVVDGTSKPILLKERTHPLFEKVLRCVRAGMNVLLVGPAGCGSAGRYARSRACRQAVRDRSIERSQTCSDRHRCDAG